MNALSPGLPCCVASVRPGWSSEGVPQPCPRSGKPRCVNVHTRWFGSLPNLFLAKCVAKTGPSLASLFAFVGVFWAQGLCAQGQVIHQVGMSASSISGIGASYEALFGGWGSRLTGFAVYDRDSRDSEEINWNLGLEIQRDLSHSEHTRFYVLLGGNYWYRRYESSNISYSNSNLDPFGEGGSSIRIHNVSLGEYHSAGIGMGIGWLFLGHLYAHTDIGMEYRKKMNASGVSRLGVAGGAGVSYRF